MQMRHRIRSRGTHTRHIGQVDLPFGPGALFNQQNQARRPSWGPAGLLDGCVPQVLPPFARILGKDQLCQT